ncbi:hypothetical protein HMPREF9701_00416 [Delftia acidovorans CCUG 274B]|uniref:phage Gp37/Gp68 family protein n=1 Tax=Delftia acidovorans TaxID=80866 RepID=UPI0003538D6E|nr:phage Gp37/Gp68 family protein [Delftia acidovorans]EPD44827.1 hypothetical protein HMPREF9701_00416 [Delftia acidovorans CCUG 274B]
MSENSKIEWTDHTFNPWEGCQKVGPGCDHCYAETRNARFAGGQAVNWGPGAPRRRTSPATWAMPRRWNAQADAFMAQHGRRQRVFCASLADWADNAVPIEWLVDLLELVRTTPHLDWLLLTKRVGIVRQRLQEGHNWVLDNWPAVDAQPLSQWLQDWTEDDTPPDNVWLGATITNQTEADRDIHKLLVVPARRRFLSMEPLLGPVDLTVIDINGDCEIYPLRGTTQCVNQEHEPAPDLPALDWVIVGGESGPGARPMHPDWASSLRDQCNAAGVPFLFKQWGEWRPISMMSEGEDRALWRSRVIAKPHEDQANLDDIYGRVCSTESTVMHLDGTVHHLLEPNAFLPGAMTMYRVGKKAAGRQLDGRTWDETPAS